MILWLLYCYFLCFFLCFVLNILPFIRITTLSCFTIPLSWNIFYHFIFSGCMSIPKHEHFAVITFLFNSFFHCQTFVVELRIFTFRVTIERHVIVVLFIFPCFKYSFFMSSNFSFWFILNSHSYIETQWNAKNCHDNSFSVDRYII